MNEQESAIGGNAEQAMQAEILEDKARQRLRDQEAVKEALAEANASEEHVVQAEILEEKARQQVEDQQAVKEALAQPREPSGVTEQVRETLNQLRRRTPTRRDP